MSGEQQSASVQADYGSYRYFTQEWTTFRELCKNPETEEENLEIAFRGLFYLAGHTDDPPPTSDTNMEQLLRVAVMLYERATWGKLVADVERAFDGE